jgi:O-antigen/teichoic acid export membrane protein
VATVLGGYLIGSAAVYLTMLGVMRREGVGEKDPEGRGAEWRGPAAREMWRFALPLVPVAIVGWVTQISDRYILGLFLGASQVGIYTVTYGLMSQPFLTVGSVVGRTLMPIYFKAVSDGHHDLQRRTFRTWLLATAAVGVAGVAAVFVFRGLVARALLFEKYRGGVELMPWIAAGYALYCVGTVFEQRLYARKLTGRVLVGNAVTAVVSVVVPLAFLYKWGMVGVAAACPVYFGVMVVTMALLARHNPAGAGVAAARPNGAAGGVA